MKVYKLYYNQYLQVADFLTVIKLLMMTFINT